MGLSYIGLVRIMQAGVALLLLASNSADAIAGASTPQYPPPSVNLSNASMDELRTHILDSCVLREWGRAAESRSSYAERCNCYARRITAVMTGEELDALRQSGIYNDSAREKAEAAQLKCNLQ